MKIVPIASSSSGNAYVVEEGDAAILIDCGVSCKAVKAAVELPRLRGVLVTHNHSDHVSGLKRLLACVDIPVYANAMTAEAIAWQEKIDDGAFACFENGQEFELGPFRIAPFSTPHDAVDPVGFLIRAGDETYFHGTDIGTPLDAIGLKLAEADVVTLESNHDPVMLRTSGRPPPLIQRIAGPRGHLANWEAAALVKKFASPRLKKLMLAHLSHACNVPGLALELMKATLLEMGRSDVELEVLS